MTKAEGFLRNPKKHLELQETSRTPTIVLSCLRDYLDAHRLLECSIILDHSQGVCKTETDGRIVSQQYSKTFKQHTITQIDLAGVIRFIVNDWPKGIDATIRSEIMMCEQPTVLE
jgi:hypothetical protein